MSRHSVTSIVRASARLLFVLLLLSTVAGVASAQPAPAAVSEGAAPPVPVSCESLTKIDFETSEATAEVTAAQVVPAASGLPAFCDVQGYVAPKARFQVRLPVSGWNGNFWMAGCNGFCGTIQIGDCNAPLSAKYAVATTDMGHDNHGLTLLDHGGGSAFYDDPAAIEDFGSRATHQVAVASKLIAATYYGQPVHHAYFSGCSTGGRQGMMEAQRYPNDFDGILVGAPGFYWSRDTGVFPAWTEIVNRDTPGA